jgi:hypothetical protein
MKIGYMTQIFSLILAFGLLLPAQTLTVTNTNNAAISPSAVVGDPLQVSITGATPSALVVLTYSYNGASNQIYNAGYTDGSGNYSESAPVPSSQIGTWAEQWSVGGTNVGPLLSFEVFDKPSSLSVVSVAASSPNACGSTYDGESTTPYGPSAAVTFQIQGASGSESVPNTGLGIMLLPQEQVGSDPVNNVGCTGGGCVSGWLWTPPSALYASSSGQFTDVPISRCLAVAFSNIPDRNSIVTSIKIGNKPYTVRTQYFTSSSSSSGHGSFYNNLGDISYSQ